MKFIYLTLLSTLITLPTLAGVTRYRCKNANEPAGKGYEMLVVFADNIGTSNFMAVLRKNNHRVDELFIENYEAPPSSSKLKGQIYLFKHGSTRITLGKTDLESNVWKAELYGFTGLKKELDSCEVNSLNSDPNFDKDFTTW